MQWVKRVNEKLKHRRNLSAKASIYHAVLVAGASRVLNIAALILEGQWLMEIVNIFRCSRENKTATACQRTSQVRKTNRSSNSWRTLLWGVAAVAVQRHDFHPVLGSGRSIDRDRSQQRALAGLHGCIRYIIFC